MKTKSEGAKVSAKKISENFHLHNSIIEGNLDAAIHCCKNTNADNIFLIDCHNEKGDTPLVCAINSKNEEIVDILLQSGADPNKCTNYGETPLIAAVKVGSQEIITRLIEEGANINKTNALEESALKIATTLGNQECITLLTENGASFSTKHQTKSTHTTSNITLEYTDSILEALKHSQKNKKSSESFKKFCSDIIKNTDRYLNKKLKNLESSAGLERTFSQLQEIDKKTCTEKDLLNISRKTIAAISSDIQMQLIKEEDTDSIYLMSKAESSIEEKITQLKDTGPAVQKIELKSDQKIQDEIQIESTNQERYDQIGESKDFFEITNEKVLCRTTNHDVVLIDRTTIKPHHPRTFQEATTLLSFAKKRLEEEKSLTSFDKAQTKTHVENIEKIIKTSKKEKRNLTNEEGRFIDQLLRPCKTARIHILHFPTKNIENQREELSVEAFETGATVHFFNYHENIETKNDLIFAGIANINKLLDDGVHPDRIILQGVENEGAVMRDTAVQFFKRNAYFTQIYINSDAIVQSDHRHVSITDPIKINKDCPELFKLFLTEFSKILASQEKNYPCETSGIFTNNKNNISLSQLINIYIKRNQEFLQNDSKYRNTSLPKERVEYIIGLTDIDENHSDYYYAQKITKVIDKHV